MKTGEIAADFQFKGNRVSKFILDTRLIPSKGPAEVSFDVDYNIVNCSEYEAQHFGVLELIVKVRATLKRRILFKIELTMEGIFTGDATKLSRDKFVEMLEMNGLITLLHISRAYIVSVTSQFGINPPVKIPMINIYKMREKKKKLLDGNEPSK